MFGDIYNENAQIVDETQGIIFLYAKDLFYKIKNLVN